MAQMAANDRATKPKAERETLWAKSQYDAYVGPPIVTESATVNVGRTMDGGHTVNVWLNGQPNVTAITFDLDSDNRITRCYQTGTDGHPMSTNMNEVERELAIARSILKSPRRPRSAEEN